MQQNPQDRSGVYLIWTQRHFAFRDSRDSALLYAYDTARQGDLPTSIASVGQSERLDPHAILIGWSRLGRPWPPEMN